MIAMTTGMSTTTNRSDAAATSPWRSYPSGATGPIAGKYGGPDGTGFFPDQVRDPEPQTICRGHPGGTQFEGLLPLGEQHNPVQLRQRAFVPDRV